MITEEQIKALAYSIWENEGRPEGKDAEHYFRAKRMLEEQEITSIQSRSKVAPVPPKGTTLLPKPEERPSGKRRSNKT